MGNKNKLPKLCCKGKKGFLISIDDSKIFSVSSSTSIDKKNLAHQLYLVQEMILLLLFYLIRN